MPDEGRANGSYLPSRLVAVGASAGGVDAIVNLVSALPADLDASVLVVLHMSPTAHSALPHILARNTKLAVSAATDGEPLAAGRVYVAPPDFHLQAESSLVRVVRGPWENGHRPGIDTLFRSAARWWTTRAIGIVLSGALDDGAAGLVAIHDAGGVALVQDPHEAAVPDMPLAALETGVVDATLTLKELAARIVELSENAQGPPEWVAADDDGLREIDLDPPLPPDAEPAGFVCPDCGGSLFEFDADSLRLRCRVGHGWTGEALREANHRRFEEALWTAVRVLEEDVALQERMASRARAQEHHHALARIERRLAERARLLEVVRTAIAEGPREEDDLSADAHG